MQHFLPHCFFFKPRSYQRQQTPQLQQNGREVRSARSVSHLWNNIYARFQTLLYLQPVHWKVRPPLPMDKQLCGTRKSQGVLPVHLYSPSLLHQHNIQMPDRTPDLQTYASQPLTQKFRPHRVEQIIRIPCSHSLLQQQRSLYRINKASQFIFHYKPVRGYPDSWPLYHSFELLSTNPKSKLTHQHYYKP